MTSGSNWRHLSRPETEGATISATCRARHSIRLNLNLEFTHVTSPIDGRVSRQRVNIGNLVQADSTQLTTIVSIDPIYAYFSMDELAALRYQRLPPGRETCQFSRWHRSLSIFSCRMKQGFIMREPSIFRITLSTRRPVRSSSGHHLFSIKSMRRWPHGSA